MDDVMNVRLNGYLGVVQNKINDYWENCGFTHASPPLAPMIIRSKYAKIL